MTPEKMQTLNDISIIRKSAGGELLGYSRLSDIRASLKADWQRLEKESKPIKEMFDDFTNNSYLNRKINECPKCNCRPSDCLCLIQIEAVQVYIKEKGNFSHEELQKEE